MKDEMKLKEEMMQQLEKIQETVNLRTRDIEQRVDEMEEGSTERDDNRRKILLGEMKKVLLKLNDNDKEIVKEFKGEAVDHIRNMTKLSNEIRKVKASLEAIPEDSEIGLVKEVDELRKKVLVLENEDEGFVACLKMSIETHESSMKAGIEILADSIVTRQQGVIFPAGVWVFPTGNLWHFIGFTGNFSPNSRVIVAFESFRQ